MMERRTAALTLGMIQWTRKQLKRIEAVAQERADVEFSDEKIKGHVEIDNTKIEVSSTTRVQPSLKLKVEDPERLAQWVQLRWPTEIVPAVRESFLSQLVPKMAAADGMLIDDNGEVCPFICLESPNQYITTRLLKDADAHLGPMLETRSLADLIRYISEDATDLDEVQA
ncbi:hypothetical protein BKG77_07110 [Mycobacteroides chelonae]|uniref:hypothetical protein n=1 Tax=Mycobacteroides chelonae TaxID=1774 RepID=UPI0008A9777F|nr:hypothetical protein [Mycobacteroides chelonae]OHU23425.1 hypothetical protein BKG77_07110 [Mycobacteroides chelonae]